MSLENRLEEFFSKKENRLIVVVGVIVLIVLLVLCHRACSSKKETFLGEFQAAPMARQRSREILAPGAKLRYTPVFSNTSQGRGNMFARTIQTGKLLNAGNHLSLPKEGFKPTVVRKQNLKQMLNSN